MTDGRRSRRGSNCSLSSLLRAKRQGMLWYGGSAALEFERLSRDFGWLLKLLHI